MKFMYSFQFFFCLMAFLCALVLVIKNIVTGAIGVLGIPFAASFLILMGLIVLCAWNELKQFKNNENKIK